MRRRRKGAGDRSGSRTLEHVTCVRNPVRAVEIASVVAFFGCPTDDVKESREGSGDDGHDCDNSAHGVVLSGREFGSG